LPNSAYAISLQCSGLHRSNSRCTIDNPETEGEWMPATSDPITLFTEKHDTYARFIRLVRYPQGIRAFFARSSLLRPGLRVLDAGCGTGVVTLALHHALARRRIAVGTFHAFDVTPAMLKRFQDTLERKGIALVETRQADVLEMDSLPDTWRHYDLIVTASMLEYVPRSRLSDALAALRERLSGDGHLLVFITRRNWLTRPMIGRWWQSNLYTKAELLDAFRRAGFSHAALSTFPLSARYLAVWGYVVEARQ
jgi:ubiquinone/menaquinone biosynthesis C-methylase UbiE